eukprot:4345967-Pyramimonas_sp.AAC.2
MWQLVFHRSASNFWAENFWFSLEVFERAKAALVELALFYLAPIHRGNDARCITGKILGIVRASATTVVHPRAF